MKAILATWIAPHPLVLTMILIWMIYNSHLRGGHAFDPYPWILLNLVLSCLRGLAVLCAPHRQQAWRRADRCPEIAQHTYDNTCSDSKLLEENTELTRQVKANTDLLEEIHLHVANIGKNKGAEMGNFPPAGAPPVHA